MLSSKDLNVYDFPPLFCKDLVDFRRKRAFEGEVDSDDIDIEEDTLLQKLSALNGNDRTGARSEFSDDDKGTTRATVEDIRHSTLF